MLEEMYELTSGGVWVPYEVELKEATASVERELALEDVGWLAPGSNVNQQMFGGLMESARQLIVADSRKYYALDPLVHQAVNIWTSYSFGQGITISSKEKGVQAIIDEFWQAPLNRKVLSATGQMMSSNKCLVDGEVFFALFLAANGDCSIRWVDPYEIKSIITNPDDNLDVRYYKRSWSNALAEYKESYYRSITNTKDEPTREWISGSSSVVRTEDALIYHLPFNTISQRGLPLCTSVLDWAKQYRKFLASRVAFMLALARFAWKAKMETGGSTTVASVKAQLNDKLPQAGSTVVENQGLDMTPFKIDSGSKSAEKDGRMLKLQIAAGTGIPEQYFGDISTGNLATAKTVELPMQKQFEMYQQQWADCYEDILNVIFDAKKVAPNKRVLDIDFPPIAPKDAMEASNAMTALLTAFPEFVNSDEVKQQALQYMGINNVSDVLELLKTADTELDKGEVQESTYKNLTNALKGLNSNLEKECK